MGAEDTDKIKEDLEEIKEALLGDYDKKGLVSRVRLIELIIKVQSTIIMATVLKIITDVLLG